jgi:type I restriction enzyme S subunit
MKGYMYILECADGSYYTGSTKDLELRLKQHQNGEGANHTKKRLPVKLVYFEGFQRIDEAFYREKQVQGWSRKKKEALINKECNKLNKLAECKNESHYAAFDSAQARRNSDFDFAQSPKNVSAQSPNNVSAHASDCSSRPLSEVEVSRNHNTPKLRFPEFSGEWKEEKLKRISKITSGGTPNRSTPNYWNGNIPWISTSLINFNEINISNEFITKEGLQNSSAKLFPIGTILMAMYGQGQTRGKVAVLKIEATTNQACAAIIPNKLIDHKFLFQELSRNYEHIRNLSNEGGQKNLSGDLIKNINAFYPQLPEQQKIASFLSSVDTKIEQLSKKKNLLEQYKKGLMQQIFSQELRFKDENENEFPDWEEKKLGEALELLTDFEANGSFASVKENVTIYDDSNFAWYVRATDLENRSSLNNVKYVDESSYNFLKKTPLFGGELLITKRGEIGKVYFFNGKENVRATVAPNMYLLKFKDTEIPKFFYYFFINIKGNNLLKRINASSTLGALYKDDVKKIKIKTPYRSEQQKIANFLTAIDTKIELVNTQLENTRKFKKGLLQQLFV